ncbi:hypothetical protein [Microbacterium sp. P05]|uniref:hypothetical protein n=1 Tax=Microbacterium sp. P05 TaxID=3366948 RepID=UPI0037467ADA
MRVRTTSTQRTYRYVRLALIAVLVFLAVGIAVQVARDGALPSVSAAYYTSSRDVFVGALCAVSVALFALSGRSLEQALLDLAAVFAPVIALVPTTVIPTAVPGLAATCPDARACVPDTLLPTVSTSVTSLLVFGVLGIAGALILARVQGTLGRGVGATAAAAALIVIGGGAWWLLDAPGFTRAAHVSAAVAFFVLIATVAALAALRPVGVHDRRRRWLRVAYALIAAGIVGALALNLVAVAATEPTAIAGIPLFFLGEALALALFAAFWVVQTVELWNEPDPSLLA